MPVRNHGAGFSLVELLVVIAILAVLAGIAVPAVGAARDKSAAAACSSKLRNIGAGIHLYCQDHEGAFPRSGHSAGTYREPGWVASIAPYLGLQTTDASGESAPVDRAFRCPRHKNPDPTTPSYGLNVFFELTPDGDDYQGAPASWRRTAHVPAPARTILAAEVGAAAGSMAADHFMCHQWSSVNAAKNAVAHDRHSGKANYLFVDGHVEALPVEATFASRTENLWNPSVAGQD